MTVARDDKETELITTLQAVVRLTGLRQPVFAFVGWAADGRPAVTREFAGLSVEARESVTSYQASRLHFREEPFVELIPLEFHSVGSAVDFPDQPFTRAEDVVSVDVI